MLKKKRVVVRLLNKISRSM